MKLSCQEGLVPGASFAEKLRNLEAYGFEGVELNGGALSSAEGVATHWDEIRDSSSFSEIGDALQTSAWVEQHGA